MKNNSKPFHLKPNAYNKQDYNISMATMQQSEFAEPFKLTWDDFIASNPDMFTPEENQHYAKVWGTSLNVNPPLDEDEVDAINAESYSPEAIRQLLY
jgi:hypothetical protein